MMITNKKTENKMSEIFHDIVGVRCPILNFNIFIALPAGLVWYALFLMEVI